jgi:ABC-type phosphate transport system substrate-binding protein
MGNLLCKPRCMAALTASLIFFVLQTASAGVAVIGNPGLSVDSITAAQVADIFLGKMPKLADGTSITVIEHQEGDSVKDEFYNKVVGKSPSQLKAYWAKLVFTGEGVPPKEYAGDKAVKDRVAATPGAIGYVNDDSVDKSVKVLFEAK